MEVEGSVRCVSMLHVSYYPFVAFLLANPRVPGGIYPSGVQVQVGPWTPRGLPLSFPRGNWAEQWERLDEVRAHTGQ